MEEERKIVRDKERERKRLSIEKMYEALINLILQHVFYQGNNVYYEAIDGKTATCVLSGKQHIL